MYILGIETSCDETAAAVVRAGNNKIEVLSNVISSQIEIHKKYGGVVPEVAAREHVLNILPVINEALGKANLAPSPLLIRRGEFKGRGLDAIAVTTGPGLITSLMVGVETAKALAYVWGIPLISVNHIEGHIYANFVGVKNPPNPPPATQTCERAGLYTKGAIQFPALILTVSGGHNMLVLMKGHGRYKIIGETIDDAAGEAFDKAATMLGLGYPGGPAISKKANELRVMSPPAGEAGYELRKNTSYELQKKLPRPMLNSKDYNFSFSGLKTALLYQLKKDLGWKKRIPEYAAEFQQAIIDVLIHKTIKAAEEFKIKTIMLTGGVAANKKLRIQMEEVIKFQIPNSRFLIPDLHFTTDNAVMIATAGYFKALKKKYIPWQKLKTDPNLVLKSWA